jgi:hypothetical protein
MTLFFRDWILVSPGHPSIKCPYGLFDFFQTDAEISPKTAFGFQKIDCLHFS